MRGASVVVSKNDDIKSLVKVNSLCSLRVARVTMLTFLPHCEVIWSGHYNKRRHSQNLLGGTAFRCQVLVLYTDSTRNFPSAWDTSLDTPSLTLHLCWSNIVLYIFIYKYHSKMQYLTYATLFTSLNVNLSKQKIHFVSCNEWYSLQNTCFLGDWQNFRDLWYSQNYFLLR